MPTGTPTSVGEGRRLKSAFLPLIIVVSLLTHSGRQAAASSPASVPRPGVTPTGDGLILDWRAPPAQVHAQDDGTFSVLMPGYLSADRPGAPQLPYTSVLVALPPDAEPTVQVLRAEETVQALPGPLALAPLPISVEGDSEAQASGGAFAPAATALDAPRDPIALEDIGVMRGVRLARVTFYPARLNADCGHLPPQRSGVGMQDAECKHSLRITTHLRAEVLFNSRQSAVSSQRSAFSDPIVEAVRGAVVNPDQVQTEARSPYHVTLHSQAAGSPLYAVEVSASGLTAVTYSALAAAGFPVAGTNPLHLHLTRAGIEIAAEWDGDPDAAFEPGERLLFYAEPRFSRYTTTDVYFLSVDALTPGLRMNTRSASPAGAPPLPAWVEVAAETNAYYIPDPNHLYGVLSSGRDGDLWMWDVLRRPDPERQAISYPVDLPAVDAAQPASLSAWLIGYTDILTGALDHRVDVSINGAPLGRIEWNGKQAISATLTIAPGILRSGPNTVRLALPGISGVGIEGVYLDAFTLRYARSRQPSGQAARFASAPARETAAAPPPALPPRVFLPLVMNRFIAYASYSLALSNPGPYRAYDVTDADHPTRLTDISVSGNLITLGDPAPGSPRRYAVTSESGILILTPDRVRLSPPLRTGGFQGADYIIVAPANLMPALANLVALRQSQGLNVAVEAAQAIYDAYGGGRPEPDAIRDYLAQAYSAWTPRPTYVLLVGDGTFDPKRYQPSSPATLLPPFLAPVDPWAGETAADNRFVTVDGNDNLPDLLIGRLPVNSIAEAQVVVDKIVKYETQPAPGGWNGQTLFVADDADIAGDFPAQSDILVSRYITAPLTAQRIYFAGNVATTHQAILDRWNAGASLITYTGHSSRRQWAAERLFHVDDVASLSNASRLPVVLQMTCFTGSFHTPSYDTLDESLLRSAQGGAVAAWGATGLGLSTGHTELADGFLRSALEDGANLGLAAISGKLSLAARQPAHLDLVDTFTLLGDPASRLNLP